MTPSIGRSTLEKFNEAPGYNQWMFSHYRPYIRWGRIWEIGSGIGNMSQFLESADFVCLSEYEDKYRDELQAKYTGRKNILVEHVDLEDLDIKKFIPYNFDTIISTNVLEHIKNHESAIQGITQIMGPETHLITLVPAHPALFSEIDRGLGHYRRYSRESLQQLLEGAGHEILSLKYFNRLSVFGWLARKWMRAPTISEADMSAVEKLLPLMKCEKFLPLPFGISLIAISKKKNLNGN